MDKNTLTGFIVIGLILFGFSWYNQDKQAKFATEQARQDSIALANAPKNENNLELSSKDFAAKSEDSLAIQNRRKSIYGEQLALALEGENQYFTIENNKMVVTIASKGAAIVSSQLKEYTSYNGTPLTLFDKNGSKFDLSLYLNRVVNTQNFNFTPVSSSSSAAHFRLAVDSLSYIDFIYSLADDSDMVDFRVNLHNMNDLISPTQRTLNFNWSNIAPQQEKGYTYENQYVTAAYYLSNDEDVEELGAAGSASETIDEKVGWVAFKQQFFSSIFVAKDGFTSSELGFNTMPEGSGFTKEFYSNSNVAYSPEKSTYDFSFYFGPNQYGTMKSYNNDFQYLIPMGGHIIGWINRFDIIPLFNFLHQFIGNFGWIIFLLTIIIKLVIFPFTYKSYLSMAKMRLIKPEMDAIAAKYPEKEDAMKKQQETMDLYRRAGVSPMGGCLPMLFQLPILIAMFRFFPASMELRGEHFLWANDLSSYDSILNLPFNIPFYGDHVSLFALLMGVSMFFSTKMSMANQGAQSNSQLPGMTFMTTYLMPVMLVVWFNSYSAALSYYYLLSNLVTMIQTVVMRRFVDDKKLHQQMKDNAAKPPKKSQWQEKYDAMVKQQQEAAATQQKGGKK